MNRTHIETLADNCPKSRRRVRRIFGIKAGQLDAQDVAEAQVLARGREMAGAASDRAKKGGAA